MKFKWKSFYKAMVMLICHLYVLFQIWDFSKKRMCFLHEGDPCGVTAIRFIYERYVVIGYRNTADN